MRLAGEASIPPHGLKGQFAVGSRLRPDVIPWQVFPGSSLRAIRQAGDQIVRAIRSKEVLEALFVAGDIPRRIPFEDTGRAFILDDSAPSPIRSWMLRKRRLALATAWWGVMKLELKPDESRCLTLTISSGELALWHRQTRRVSGPDVFSLIAAFSAETVLLRGRFWVTGENAAPP